MLIEMYHVSFLKKLTHLHHIVKLSFYPCYWRQIICHVQFSSYTLHRKVPVSLVHQTILLPKNVVKNSGCP